MKIEVNEAFVQQCHEEVYADAKARGGGDRFLRMSQRYVEGHWRRFFSKIELFSKPIRGGTFVDYGCKFGHLTPLLVDQGVENIYAVDVEDEYIRDGENFFGERFPVKYFKSDRCYVNIPSSSADFILVNEVISHINPAFLDIFYAEVARILKPEGELIISDGNNWCHLQTRLDLIEWYSLWESGNSKEFGEHNYLRSRASMIKLKFRELSDEQVDFLAKNTSGYYGDQIFDAVERYISGKTFVERPHRPGVYPTHPGIGVVMERAFDPRQVMIALETYGIDAVQVLRGKEIDDDFRRGSTKNFTIRGRKIPETIEALSEYARNKLGKEEENGKFSFLSNSDIELFGVAKYLISLRDNGSTAPDAWLERQIKDTERQLRLRRKLADEQGKQDASREIAQVIRLMRKPDSEVAGDSTSGSTASAA